MQTPAPRPSLAHPARRARPRVVVVVGTRPEAIKLAPVIFALRARADRVETVVLATSQHGEMLTQALGAFGITPDVDLGLMRHAQTYEEFTARAIAALSECLGRLAPDAMLVQGDTATVAAAAMVGRARGLLVGHVEAGLRSWDLRDPFPEELNRLIATMVSDIHFAPTEAARRNLLFEGVSAADVLVTGNTVVDALTAVGADRPFENERLAGIDWAARRVLLVTVHRRENHGDRLVSICAAVRAILERHPGVEAVLPVHRNPAVDPVVRASLGGARGVHLVEPLSYPDTLGALRRCHFVLSDSGGLQEETPSFGKPMLVLRDRTERPEAVENGFARLVGACPAAIEAAASRLLADPSAYARMCGGTSPFGDGTAAPRIVDALLARLEAGTRSAASRAGVPAGRGLPDACRLLADEAALAS